MNGGDNSKAKIQNVYRQRMGKEENWAMAPGLAIILSAYRFSESGPSCLVGRRELGRMGKQEGRKGRGKGEKETKRAGERVPKKERARKRRSGRETQGDRGWSVTLRRGSLASSTSCGLKQ